MDRYSRMAVEFILHNYWILKSGSLPNDDAMVSHRKAGRSPHETASVWCADVDLAIDKLDPWNPDRWLTVAKVITEPRLETVVHRFSRRQQVIMRSYLLPDQFCGYSDAEMADSVTKSVLRLINESQSEEKWK